MGHWLLILKFAIRMFSKINITKLVRSPNKLRQIAMKPGQKSPVSHLLETASQSHLENQSRGKHNKPHFLSIPDVS